MEGPKLRITKSSAALRFMCTYVHVLYYTVCYFAGIFYAVVRHISVLFIDNKDSVFCKVLSVRLAQNFAVSKRQNFN